MSVLFCLYPAPLPYPHHNLPIYQVFCFPCILHYFSTSANPKWIRCPICFDTVNEKQLKSVHWFDGPSQYEDEADEPHPEASSSSSSPDNGRGLNGSTLRMRLMQRPQITTLALPRSPTWPSDLLPPHQAPFHFLPDVYTYSKFMLASPTYLVENLTRDLDDLAVERRMLASLGDNLSLMFIEAAESKVQVQIAKATALDTDVLRNSIDRAVQVQHDIEARVSHHNMRRKLEQEAAAVVTNPDASEVPQAYLATRASPFNTVPAVDISAPTQVPQSPQSQPPSQSQRNPRQRRNLNPPPPSTSTYYYYQAASGMPIFLHPLDIKILNAHFNGYASFPDSITVRVESFAEGSVNDDLRKRCKYLSHMPEGADVVFVEADLSGVVGADGLRNFEGALKTRRARRKEKGKKDDRAKAKAEEREKERLNHDFGAGRTWRTGAEAEVQAFGFEVPREMMVEDVDVEAEEETVAPPPQVVSGAWGSRSFASAAHSGSGGGTTPAGAGGQRAPRTLRDEQDEWDLDFAWHEMEQRASGGAGAGGAVGGRKKKSNKLVVLGSGPGRRR